MPPAWRTRGFYNSVEVYLAVLVSYQTSWAWWADVLWIWAAEVVLVALSKKLTRDGE